MVITRTHSERLAYRLNARTADEDWRDIIDNDLNARTDLIGVDDFASRSGDRVSMIDGTSVVYAPGAFGGDWLAEGPTNLPNRHGGDCRGEWACDICDVRTCLCWGHHACNYDTPVRIVYWTSADGQADLQLTLPSHDTPDRTDDDLIVLAKAEMEDAGTSMDGGTVEVSHQVMGQTAII